MVIKKSPVNNSAAKKSSVVLLIGVVLSFAISFITQALLNRKDIAAAAECLGMVERALEKSLSDKFRLLASFENFVLSEEFSAFVSRNEMAESVESKFSLLAQTVSAADPEILSIELGPNGVLVLSSGEGRENLTGLDLLIKEPYQKTVLHSIQSRQPAVSEMKLQGKNDPVVFISHAVHSTKADFDLNYWKKKGRFPEGDEVWTEIPKSYWGTISVLLDTRTLLKECGLDNQLKPFSLTIKSKGTTSDADAVLLGDDESYGNAIQMLNFGFSGLEWSLAVSRTDSSNHLLSGSALILGLILTGAAASQCRLTQMCKHHVSLIAENVNANQAKTQFLATMSHELRTPIHSIMVYAESLVENIYGPISEPQRKVVEHLQKASEHLLELVNDILDINKIESNQLTLDLAKHSVNSTCKESLEMVRNQIREKNLHLDFNADLRIPEFSFDSRRMKQVLINLLYNAIKFTPPEGHILLETELLMRQSAGSVCRITVKDSGIGISEEDQKELFQPFKQVDNPLVKKSNGVGLGLYISRSIIELHHGKISIQSETNQGSSFIIDLPVEHVAEEETSDFRI